MTDREADALVASLSQLASSDPERARREAIAGAAATGGSHQIALLSVAAEASIRVGTISDALTLFRRAADLAEGRADAMAAPLRVRIAAMLAASGDSELALQTRDAAEPLLGENAWLAWGPIAPVPPVATAGTHLAVVIGTFTRADRHDRSVERCSAPQR